jgi:hypothetical protein
MAVLGVPAGWAMGPLGTSWSELRADAPALMLLGMAVTMTVPMGRLDAPPRPWLAGQHGDVGVDVRSDVRRDRPGVGQGLVEDIDALMIVEHVAMLLSMLAAMLFRSAAYTCDMPGHGRVEQRVIA